MCLLQEPVVNLHTGRGVCPEGKPWGLTQQLSPIGNIKTILLIGFHLGFIQVIKPPGPMEQFTICLLGFHLEFIPVLKSPGPMEQLTIFVLGFPSGLWNPPAPWNNSPYFYEGFPWGLYNSKKVKSGKRPTCMKSAKGSLFRQIFPKIWHGT